MADDVNVVTSENLSAFVEKKLNLAAPEPAPVVEGETQLTAPAVESEASAETPESESETDEHSDSNTKDTRRQRFSELTEKRKAAEALAERHATEAKTEREARLQAERQTAELRAKYEPPPAEELGPQPQLNQFNNVDEYAKALTDWAGDKAIRAERKQEAETRQQALQQATEKAWQERQIAARKEIPTYDADIAANKDLEVHVPVREAILESEFGPKLLHHLAKNPDYTAKLYAMSPASAVREIGKLEASLTPKNETVSGKEISRAPAPITPIKATSAPGGPAVGADGEFHGSYEEWKAARKAGKIK